MTFKTKDIVKQALIHLYLWGLLPQGAAQRIYNLLKLKDS
jgi:hypothetical protein